MGEILTAKFFEVNAVPNGPQKGFYSISPKLVEIRQKM